MRKACYGFMVIILIGINFKSQAQQSYPDSTLVQFSGVVLTSDSLQSLPYVAVRNTKNKIIALSDADGFFSLVVKKGDTVFFSENGYRTVKYIIPLRLMESRYSVVQLMSSDTQFLEPTFIYPWPTKRQFDYQFVYGSFQDDQLEYARRNLESESSAGPGTLRMDASENYREYMKQQQQKMYINGQMPSTQLLNPIAWAKFFDAWKSGKYKIR